MSRKFHSAALALLEWDVEKHRSFVTVIQAIRQNYMLFNNGDVAALYYATEREFGINVPRIFFDAGLLPQARSLGEAKELLEDLLRREASFQTSTLMQMLDLLVNAIHAQYPQFLGKDNITPESIQQMH